MKNVNSISSYFLDRIKEVGQVKAIKGKGLMLGASFDFPVAELRKALIYEEGIFTGGSADPNLLRILPPLSVGKKEIDIFITTLKNVLTKMLNHESS